jgi:hypothetical protein
MHAVGMQCGSRFGMTVEVVGRHYLILSCRTNMMNRDGGVPRGYKGEVHLAIVRTAICLHATDQAITTAPRYWPE